MGKRPLTEQQLAANRANAQKSTGPRTPEGKRNSSRNAISRGSLASAVVLPDEAAGAFYSLLRSYTRQFEPASQDEYDLVETMAVCRWRIVRGWSLESRALIHQRREQAASNGHEDPPTQTMLAQRMLDHPPRSQEALARHEVRLDRSWHRAADRLREIQAARKKEALERTHQTEENKETSAIYEPKRTVDEPLSNPEQTLIGPII
jgi:hypothetical protein